MQTYTVTLIHPNDPTNRWSGQHAFYVSEDREGDATRYYAKATGFGCGRNCKTPELAIRALAAESAATVTAVTPT